ncbi:hypothetical protein LIER_04415 [Lithospermum erythrorhizon]|uniref:Uncharacterized protein n=1 Tax=Lithospermum erythrorhizon TaxID=34254 RepID=A0AAV3NXH4_LITER
MTPIDREGIKFSEKELEGIEIPHDDPLIISPVIANFLVARMLVDTGSSANILYLGAYDWLGLPPKPFKTGMYTSHSIHRTFHLSCGHSRFRVHGERSLENCNHKGIIYAGGQIRSFVQWSYRAPHPHCPTGYNFTTPFENEVPNHGRSG